ncbi:unnamed protein product [Spirodela intermedia]|uniref:Uncharacterized protein n=1 Tax=Spirodela intermedia TaxID=51605 RepID=A0A7I8IBY6_SPIIN|nr:unnamed protein product [Spirodela intermedia]CAA6655090.1 unnamed protein product [Spirodela intermedia]
MDQVCAWRRVSKSCFKCNHCKGTLNNFSSRRVYCIASLHFELLFKETAATTRAFSLAAVMGAEKVTPALVRTPSKAASMFSGTQEKCATCGKTAYPLKRYIISEKKAVTVEGRTYHRSCFKCFHGGLLDHAVQLRRSGGHPLLQAHFSQLFKEKGSYNHLIKCASVKRPAAPPPPEA